MKRLLVSLIAVCFLVGAGFSLSWAATTPNSLITAQTPNNGKLSIGPTGSCTAPNAPYTCCTGAGAGCVAGTYYNLYTAGANGSKCNGIILDSTDTATHIVTCQVKCTTGNCAAAGINAVGNQLTTTAAGVAGQFAAPQNFIASANWPGLPVDSDSNPYLQLVTGDSLVCTFATAITASTQLGLIALCGDF